MTNHLNLRHGKAHTSAGPFEYAIVNGTFLMAYLGEGPGLSYATSPDGVNWTTPSFQLIIPGSNSSIMWPSLLLNGSQLLLRYYESRVVSQYDYIAGISVAACSFAFILGPTSVVSVTGTVTTSSPTTVTSTSVLTNTRTVTSTVVSTTPSLVGLPTTMLEVATAGSVVAAAALVALVVLRLATRRQT